MNSTPEPLGREPQADVSRPIRQKIWRRLMRPGWTLMRSVTIPTKMAITSLLVLSLVALLALPLVLDTIGDLRLQGRQLDSVAKLRDAVALVRLAQSYRGEVLAQVEPAALERARVRLLAATEPIERAQQAAISSAVGELYAALSAHARALAKYGSGDAAPAMDVHHEMFSDLNHLFDEISGAARLSSGMDPEGAYLVEIVTLRYLPWVEALATVRIVGAKFSQQPASRPLWNDFDRQVRHLADTLSDTQRTLDSIRRLGLGEPAGWIYARNFSSDVIRAGTGPDAGSSAEWLRSFDASAGQGIEGAHAFVESVLSTLESKIAARKRSHLRNAVALGGLTLLLLAVFAYFGLSFYVTFVFSVHRVRESVASIARGDLTESKVLVGHDELAEISAMVAAMAQRLSGIVSNIRSNATLVAMAGGDFSQGSSELAQRTRTQEQSLAQTSAALREVSKAVERNADFVREAGEMAASVRSTAEQGVEVMGKTVDVMDEVEQGAARVGEIVSTIEDLAFQTNMLALNAAVQAARAGAAGKAFSVVASEVRTLARRCAEAAGQIGELSEQSSATVRTSVRRVSAAQQKLDEIVAGVRDLAGRVEGVAAASTEQSANLLDVSSSIGELDRITRSNSELVGRTEKSVGALARRATSLTAAVNTIKLAQGSTDEAFALVNRAVELIETMGIDAAREILQDRDGGYFERDLAVIVLDRDGTYQVFAGEPSRVGKPVIPMLTSDGNDLLEECWRAIDQRGDGWFEYARPAEGDLRARPKIAYARRAGDNFVVWVGVYRYFDEASLPDMVAD